MARGLHELRSFAAGEGSYYRVVGDEINHHHTHQNYDYH
jgi:hypothetical protein